MTMQQLFLLDPFARRAEQIAKALAGKVLPLRELNVQERVAELAELARETPEAVLGLYLAPDEQDYCRDLLYWLRLHQCMLPVLVYGHEPVLGLLRQDPLCRVGMGAGDA